MLKLFFRNTDGATAIEYALIASVISISIIAGVNLWSDEAVAMFNRISQAVTSH